MKAIIMAGGEGSRLRPLTNRTPKPLIPVCGKPCVYYSLDMLAAAGIEEVMLTLHYRAQDVIDRIGSSYKGMKVRYLVEERPVGTAGGVLECADFLRGEKNFVVTSGDSVCDLDIAEAIEFHNVKGAEATVLLARTANVLEYGVVVTDDDDAIVRFIEKPAWGQAFTDTVNTGAYVFDESILGRIPKGVDYDFGRDLFPALEADGASIYGYVTQGKWYDIGDPASYIECTLDLNGGSYVAPSARCEIGSLVSDSVIMDGAIVGRGAVVEHAIVAPDSYLPAKKTLRDAVWYGGKEYPIGPVGGEYAFGLSLGCAHRGARIGIGGPARSQMLSGCVDAGANVRDLGDADARLCAFAAREYRLDCAVWAGDTTVVFDTFGLAAPRSFTRKIRGGRPARIPGTVTHHVGLGKRYVLELAASIETAQGVRFVTDDPLVRSALERKGAVWDEQSDLRISSGVSGLDLWHLCAIIINNSDVKEIALPYIAPETLINFAQRKGVRVRKYATVPFDGSENEVRSLVLGHPWTCDVCAAAVKVVGLIASLGKTLADLVRDIPVFDLGELEIKGDERTRIAVMKSFGAPDGEGVVRVFARGRVRAVPDDRGIRLIAEAVSVEAADEILGLAAKEIEKYK